MPAALPRAAALLAVLPALARADCASHRSCGGCLADDGDEACAWCYSSSKCVVAYRKSNPSLQDWSKGPAQCGDWTMDLGTCECRPNVYTSCDDCTSHLGCVWIREATTTVTTTLDVPVVGPVTSVNSRNWTDTCWKGDGLRGPHFTKSVLRSSALTIELNYTATRWAWAQCEIDGIWPAVIAIVVVGLAAGAVCSCLSCLCGGGRKRGAAMQ